MSCSRCAAARQAAVRTIQQTARGDVAGAVKSSREVIAEIKAKVAERLSRSNG